MSKLFGVNAMLLATCLMLSGCEALSPQKKEEPKGGGGGGGGGDSSKAMVDAMKASPAPYIVVLPAGAKVGTWWEHTTKSGGTESKTRWAVVADQGGKLVVENPMDMGGTTVITAYLVDPAVDITATPVEGQKMAANVSKAWVGAKGGAPEEKKVMDAPVYKKTEGGQKVDYTEGDEKVDLAGKSWDSHWVKTKDAKTWSAKNFMLKSEGASYTMTLTGWGEDAKPALKW